jgi:hypothetical protein
VGREGFAVIPGHTFPDMEGESLKVVIIVPTGDAPEDLLAGGVVNVPTILAGNLVIARAPLGRTGNEKIRAGEDGIGGVSVNDYHLRSGNGVHIRYFWRDLRRLFWGYKGLHRGRAGCEQESE